MKNLSFVVYQLCTMHYARYLIYVIANLCNSPNDMLTKSILKMRKTEADTSYG